MEFKIGDVVHLKSDCTIMTIIGFVDEISGIDYMRGVRSLQDAIMNYQMQSTSFAIIQYGENKNILPVSTLKLQM